MNKLWAPWRKSYILKHPVSKCFICRIKASSQDAKNFILKRSHYSFAVLNIFPYNNGHMMITSNRHVDGLEKLKDQELLDLLQLMNQITVHIKKTLKPQGLNIGINLGHVAGAGVPGHVHIHIVPRWSGDTNFMPVVANTKVLSESLRSVYQRLKGSRLKK